MVLRTGLEPVWINRQILSLLRIPVSPPEDLFKIHKPESNVLK